MSEYKDILKLIKKEEIRQQNTLELIASENICSKNIRLANGSFLTNKYAEGYPNQRYYSGCEVVDEIEQLAIDLSKKLYNCEFANVQPHSGSNANEIAFFSFLEKGDRILGMSLDCGGHLTHGFKLNFSGTNYESYSYNTNEEGYIDYDSILKQAKEIKPKLIIAGASAYPRKIDFSKFREIANETDSILMVDMAHIAGLVAVGLHQSPIPYADITTSTTHKTLRGPRGGLILSSKKYEKQINRACFPGFQGGPLENTIAGKAICFQEALQNDFKKYQEQVIKNAKVLAKELKNLGFNLVTNGTDNHLILIDLRNKNISGKKAQRLLEECGISVNKNAIPFDPKPPTLTSGIRIGTPACTTRGFREEEMKIIAKYIKDIIDNPDNNLLYNKIKNEIVDLLKQFPIDNI
jgi:glycine hydroxymethyltransferase